MSHIVYNVNWPGAGDPMYLLNAADNMARRSYYGVSWVPWIDIIGTQFDHTLGQAAFINTINAGNAQFAPFNIVLTQNALGESLIEVGVKIIRDPSDVNTYTNTKLRVALTEKTVSYASPPGSNGEKDFFSVCRKMLPDAGGSSFTIPAPGDSVELTLQYVPTSAFLAAVNLDSIRVVAFIQDDNSKLVYQSAMLEFVPQYVATINSSSPDQIITNNGTAQFSAFIHNQGIMDDTYDITATFDGTAGWTGDFSTINGTFQFGETNPVQVMVGDFTQIDVTVNPNNLNGSGIVTVEFTSQNNPGVTGSMTFSTVTITGVAGLIIDASGEGYANVLINAVEQEFEYPLGIVSREALYPGIDLTNFTLVCWSTGNAYPVFTEDEVDALMPFLDNGGRLLINGQNIGEDIFSPSGQSQFAQDFYHNYLHSSYVDTTGLTFFFRGIDGDPISQSHLYAVILTNLYPQSPDQFIPYDASATSLFTFSTFSQYNSIRADDAVDRVVYFGFGLEQVSQDTTRDTLITRAINWLMNGVLVGTPNENISPASFNLNQNYPNPFNPATTITYSIPEETQVNLKIYDVMGREVAVLVNGRQQAGTYEINFNAASLASGTYFYKLTAGEFVSVKKMVLLK
jgi:hypothetical protein